MEDSSAYRERTTIVVDGIDNGRTCSEVESGAREVGLVDRDEVVRATVSNRIRAEANSGGLTSVKGGHRQRGGCSKDEGGEGGEHR